MPIGTIPLLPAEELDLTNLSREGLVSRLQFLFNQANPNWREFSVAYPENLTLEGMGLLVSGAVEHSRELVRQKSLATISDRLAAIREGRPVNFDLTGAAAATLDGVFSVSTGTAAKRIPLEAGKRVQSGSAIYAILTVSEILTGSASATVAMINAEEVTDTVQSDGEANWIVKLSRTPYVDQSLSIVAGNGTFYSRKESGTSELWRSFTEMSPDDPGYITMMDNNGYVYVMFGNSIYGKVPLGTVNFTYKIGGGVDGRVSAGASWKILDPFYDEDGDTVNLVFTNPTSGSVGGVDPMSVEEARVRLPVAIRTIDRVVNEDDAEYVTTSIAGIARAVCLTSNQDASVGEDEASIRCVAEGTQYTSGHFAPATPTSAQLAAATALMEEDGDYPFSMDMLWNVLAAPFLDINIAVKVHKAQGYTAVACKAAILVALQDFFAVSDANGVPNSNVDFGANLKDVDGDPDYKIPWGHIHNAIQDSPAVREIPPSDDDLLLNNVDNSIVLQPYQFPRLGTLTVYDMDNGGVAM